MNAVTTGHETRPDLRSQSTEISNRIAALHREHYGRGASRVRTMIHQDVVMTRLEDCFTTVERTMIAEGAFAQVRETRTMFQDWMCPRFIEVVERVTGRKVRSYMSQVARDPEVAVELFLLEPVDGNGARPSD